MRVCDGAFRSATVAGFVVCLVAFAFAFAFASASPRRLTARQFSQCRGWFDCAPGETCNAGRCEMLGQPNGNNGGPNGNNGGGGPPQNGGGGDFANPNGSGQEPPPNEGNGGGRGTPQNEGSDWIFPQGGSPSSQSGSPTPTPSKDDSPSGKTQISHLEGDGNSTSGSVGSENSTATPTSDDAEKSKDFLTTTAGKAIMGTIFGLLVVVMIVISVFICRNRRNKHRIGSAKGFRAIPGDDVSGEPERRPSPPPMLTLDTRIVNPEPFLEPHMITPLEGHDMHFFAESPTAASNMTTVVSHDGSLTRTLSRTLLRVPPRSAGIKRSSTIYGNQGSSTANVELNAADVTTQYPMVQQHHFMSSEYENNES